MARGTAGERDAWNGAKERRAPASKIGQVPCRRAQASEVSTGPSRVSMESRRVGCPALRHRPSPGTSRLLRYRLLVIVQHPPAALRQVKQGAVGCG